MKPKSKHLLPAFTILEITIGMLISAVVIGITYTAYNIITKSYLGFRDRNNEITNVTLLDKLLRKDFDEADFIRSDDKSVTFYQNSVIKSNYEFTDQFVIRRSGIIDTFKTIIQDRKVLFENRRVEQVTNDTEPEKGRTDELSFIVRFKEEAIPCHYQKSYSSVNLIQRNPNAVN